MSGQTQRRLVTRSKAGLTNISVSSAATQPDGNSPNQFQSFNIDLTNLDDSVDSKNNVGLSTHSPYLVCNNYGQPQGGKMESSSFMHGTVLDAVPKFDSEAPEPSRFEATHSMPMPSPYDTFDMNPAPDINTQLPEPIIASIDTDIYQIQYFAQASPPVPGTTTPPTPRTDRELSRAATEALTGAEIDHVPPNRIVEAGPVPHPDREWRPYGTNHWHVFLASPDTLKYLSTSEIKEIREHCYQLSKAVGAGPASASAAVALEGPDTTYTTGDAQAVWKHCDAYIRRRGQLRNNNAARRSRQRKDSELRYWRQKALEYGCPDHEFMWDGLDVGTPGPLAEGSAAAPAAAAGPQTRARARQGRPVRGRGPRRGAGVIRQGPAAEHDFVAQNRS